MAEHAETNAVMRILAEVQEIQKTIPSNKVIAPLASVSIPLKPIKKEDNVNRLLELLRSDWILSVIGYFVNHRPGLPYTRLDDEYKVQDLIYCLASTQFPDLQFENPQQKNVGAVTFTRVDFFSAKAQLFLEIKLANSRHEAKQIEKEISEDMVKYGRQKNFKTLIFFIYSQDYTLPNPRDFERGFTGQQSIHGYQFQTHCIVKP